jgi:MFS family permease
MKVTGKNELVFNLTSIIALLIGGVVGSVEHVLVFKIGIVLAVITFLIGLLFKEPKLNKEMALTEDGVEVGSEEGLKKKKLTIGAAIKAQYVDSFKVIQTRKKLSYLIIFSALVGMFVTLSFFYLQIAWKAAGYIEWQIGIVLAVAAVAAIAGALLAEKMDSKFGEIGLLKYSPFFVAIGLFFFYDIGASLIAFSLLSFVESLMYVAMRDYINRIIPSEKRATILSFESMMFSFFMILIFPLFGYVSDIIEMNVAFVILGGILIVLSIVNFSVLSKGITKDQSEEDC